VGVLNLSVVKPEHPIWTFSFPLKSGFSEFFNKFRFSSHCHHLVTKFITNGPTVDSKKKKNGPTVISRHVISCDLCWRNYNVGWAWVDWINFSPSFYLL